MREFVTFVSVLMACSGLTGCYAIGPLSPLRPLERSMVFQPARFPEGDWHPVEIEPEDVFLTTSDGVRLHGWYLGHSNPKGVALFCHGNAGNVSGLAETMQILNRRHELSVMVFDYRGYGKSGGSPSEQGVYKDARAARAWLAQREGIAETDIIMMGQSLGGAVATDLAAKDGARALILASTFSSLPAVANKLMPMLPARLLMTYRFDSVNKIRDYHGPLFISHGNADEVVSFQLGKDLFAAAGTEQKQFLEIEGGRHNDPMPEDYRLQLQQFLAELPDSKDVLQAKAVDRKSDRTRHAVFVPK